MKQSDSMLIIYPRNVPSSSLVENGYGIALTKKIVIFHKEKIAVYIRGGWWGNSECQDISL